MGLQRVTTTGIYCRAECTARPRPENVHPVRSAVEALAAGYRPCLLCRPDRLPGLGLESPAIEVAHALRLIADGYLDTKSAEELATHIGYSSRQLSRLFAEHVGATPDFVARARRAHLARRMLDETDLSMTELAFAAGFSSTRQLNRVMRTLFGFSPTQLRAKRRKKDRLDDALDGGLQLRLPFAGQVDVDAMMGFLRARAIPGVEAVEESYVRTISTCGHAGVAEVRAGGADHLRVVLHLPTFGSILDVVGSARSLFGLDRDLAAARRALFRDPVLGSAVRRTPRLRLPGAWDPFETAVRILVGQQVSVAGASTLSGRIAARFGSPIDAKLPAALAVRFPSPQQLAEADLCGLGMPVARARGIRAFAQAVALGDVDLSSTSQASLEETLAPLRAVRGVGPWSANLIASRVMGHDDAFPSSDLGLRRGATALLGLDTIITARELEALSQQWRPFRAMAAALLWSAQ